MWMAFWCRKWVGWFSASSTSAAANGAMYESPSTLPRGGVCWALRDVQLQAEPTPFVCLRLGWLGCGLTPGPRCPLSCRQEPYVISTQALPPGMLLCGTGLITHSLLFTALARHASGNVQVLVGRAALPCVPCFSWSACWAGGMAGGLGGSAGRGKLDECIVAAAGNLLVCFDGRGCVEWQNYWAPWTGSQHHRMLRQGNVMGGPGQSWAPGGLAGLEAGGRQEGTAPAPRHRLSQHHLGRLPGTGVKWRCGAQPGRWVVDGCVGIRNAWVDWRAAATRLVAGGSRSLCTLSLRGMGCCCTSRQATI